MALKIDCFTTILPWWRHHLNIEQTTFPLILSKKSMRLASCLVESVLSTFAKLAHPFEGKEITQDPVLLVLRYFESFLFLPKCLTLPRHSLMPSSEWMLPMWPLLLWHSSRQLDKSKDEDKEKFDNDENDYTLWFWGRHYLFTALSCCSVSFRMR